MRIAVDAVGGDFGAAIVVPGAVAGARRFGVGLDLAGPEGEVRRALAAVDAGGIDLAVVDAPEAIAMDAAPALAVRRQPRSSIGVALAAVRDGRAGAMVSAGNSGAVMAAALLVLGRIPGVERPAIAALLPSPGQPTLVLDLGAVTDPKPHHLVQFAQMGAVYAAQVLGRARPTVGLLSNGEEASKGNQLVRETYPLLARTPGIDFRGNVEGRDLTRGIVDVVVTDGFTGNVALKVAEGVAGLVGEVIRAEATATVPRRLGSLLMRTAFGAVRAQLDYAERGGAPLLGVNGVVVVAHGRSTETAIMNAIGVAQRGAAVDLAGTMRRVLGAAANAGGGKEEPGG
jgi:glycerol-3-phosphate acyltransferase PlsX